MSKNLHIFFPISKQHKHLLHAWNTAGLQPRSSQSCKIKENNQQIKHFITAFYYRHAAD